MRKQLIWGYAAQFLQYGVGLIALPVLLHKLSSAELGVWYIFMTIAIFVEMLDSGFTPTMARSVSFVMGGAKTLRRIGYEIVGSVGEVDFGLMRSLIRASRRIFGFIAIIALLLVGSLGTWYIFNVTRQDIPPSQMLICWIIFVPSVIINLYYKYITPLLQGRGIFDGYYKSLVYSKVAFAVVVMVTLSMNVGLVGISIGYLVSSIVGRLSSAYYLYDSDFNRKIELSRDGDVPTSEVFLILWANAWRLGLVVFGGFLATRASNIIASSYLGLAVASQLALTAQLFAAIRSVSVVVANIDQQKMARLRVSGDDGALRRQVSETLASSLLLFIIMSVVVITFGGYFMEFIGGHTTILGRWMLLAIAVAMVLELNFTLANNVIATGNNVPFVWSVLISGCCIVILSIVGVHYFHFGLWWIIVVPLIVQMAYNNWRWPMVLSEELGIGYLQLLGNGMISIAKKAAQRSLHR